MYTIYEIPGVKVGCDYRWPLRAHEQGVNPDECKILQQESDLIQVSIDEMWWQIELGYPVDSIPYFKIVEFNRKRASSGGIRAHELGYTSKGGVASYEKQVGIHNPDKILEYASIGGKAAVLVGAQSKAGKVGSQSPNCGTRSTSICKYCGHEGQTANLGRWHNENCKKKPSEEGS